MTTNTISQTAISNETWTDLCDINDLIINSGVCALINNKQIAIFAIQPFGSHALSVYAISNYDPIGNANVMYRGILGSIEGVPVISSPLYKQHYSLIDGNCLEQSEFNLDVYQCRVQNNRVEINEIAEAQ